MYTQKREVIRKKLGPNWGPTNILVSLSHSGYPRPFLDLDGLFWSKQGELSYGPSGKTLYEIMILLLATRAINTYLPISARG